MGVDESRQLYGWGSARAGQTVEDDTRFEYHIEVVVQG
jgi:hypothetical protein